MNQSIVKCEHYTPKIKKNSHELQILHYTEYPKLKIQIQIKA
jgi:hypothetical protein